MHQRSFYLMGIFFFLIWVASSFNVALANGDDVGELLNLSTGGLSKTAIRLEINGKMVANTGGAQIINGRSLVPLKPVTEALGLPMTWYETSQTVRIEDTNAVIILKVGDAKAQVGDQTVQLDIAPLIVDGQVLVPLRFLGDVLEAKVEWLPEQMLVKLHRSLLGKVAFERYPDRTRLIFDLTLPEDYEVFRLHSPERLVIDLPGARYPDKKTIHSVNTALVSTLRVSQFQLNPPIARAVIDLESPDIEYKASVLSAQGKLIIDITKKAGRPTTSTAPASAPAASSAGEKQAVKEQPKATLKEQTPATLKAPPSVLMNKLIAIDPGHGGKNPGAIGVTGVWESEVNYDIAKRLNELLLEAGAFTLMTRKGEQDPNLYDRAKMANESHADIFVSVHSDAHPKPETRGTTVYAHHNASQTTWALGWYVHNEIVQATGLKSMGLRSANFVVVREPKMPAILVETAYLTNREDEALLKDPEFRQKIAQAIFNGILLYFDNKK